MFKKLINITVIVFTFLFWAIALPAYARNGPHIGGEFPKNTDACAACHRVHTASGIFILKEGTSVYDFCISCHNGTGANTNVADGRFEGTVTSFGSQNDGTPGNGLNAGGFINSFKYTGRSGRTSSWQSVSSRHKLNGLDNSSSYVAWGGGDNGPGTEIFLDCVSCHNPHGSTNTDGTERYRIIRNTVNNIEVGPISAYENSGKDYTKIRYRSGFSDFCSACHTQYTKGSSFYKTTFSDTTPRKRYRHTVPKSLSAGDGKTGNNKTIAYNMNSHIQLPVEQFPNPSNTIKGSDILNCVTCHQAHGTSISVSSSAKVNPANSSTLLRLKDRGVCQNCHQR